MSYRDDFPIITQSTKAKPLVYLDNASTTQKPQVVIDTISKYYSEYNANIHRGVYDIAEKATLEFENVRDKVSTFINSGDRIEVVFTKGTTESINLVAYSWGRKFIKPGDEILITEMEHHSNNIPWQLLSKDLGASLKYIPVDKNGELDNPLNYISPKTKFVSIIHQSNVLGTVNSVKEIILKSHEVGAKVLLDGAQSITHLPIDVQDLGCDFFTFSAHKLMGPTGVGVLYGKKELLNQMDPFLSGGAMISEVSLHSVSFNDLPWKFEAGTPNIAQVIGFGAAIDYINHIGLNVINKHCDKLKDYAQEKLSNIKDIIIYGNSKNRGPVFSFNIKGIHPYDLAQLLNEQNICLRVGHHCAQPLLEKFGVTSSARVSFYIYNTIDDIDRLVDGINKSVAILS